MGHQNTVPDETVQVYDEELPYESPIFRNKWVVENNGGELCCTLPILPEVHTTVHLLQSVSKIYKDAPCLGQRQLLPNGEYGDYKWITYHELGQQVENVAYGFYFLGLRPQQHVCICLQNCIQWQVSFFAAQMANLIPIPVSVALRMNEIIRFAQHADCDAIILHRSFLPEISPHLFQISTLRIVIIVGYTQEDPKLIYNSSNTQSISIIDFHTLLDPSIIQSI